MSIFVSEQQENMQKDEEWLTKSVQAGMHVQFELSYFNFLTQSHLKLTPQVMSDLNMFSGTE